MRITSCLTLLAALTAPALAQANCYSIYDAKNQLAFQSTIAPVDLSRQISDAMRARFPGGYLVMIPGDDACREYRAGSTVRPRFDAGGLTSSSAMRSEEILQASPLLSGTRSTMYGDNQNLGGGVNDTASREAARSGTTLNVRRQAPPARP